MTPTKTIRRSWRAVAQLNAFMELQSLSLCMCYDLYGNEHKLVDGSSPLWPRATALPSISLANSLSLSSLCGAERREMMRGRMSGDARL